MRIGFVFRSFPHSSAKGREGLDALLAASAFCDDIDVFFIGDGVTQLCSNQDPKQVLSRDYIAAFKLLDLYDIENVFVCKQSLLEFSLEASSLVITSQALSVEEIRSRLHQCDKIVTF
ncbi:sulfurtransferase complex subunit TusC [Vibrio rumoiensis]|uniref:Protein TusC homolog n=1 Tax=Vibrio rumoiensis 1S-45 TaxID=1188252 RepID=A0A1E5E6H8_9VIBR|nr:sulfurtransferase complex subunit TusC [Vibrio rumoiensis]OEF30101.1 sulfurtransferase TusC [Vibrio rumoiensis 1S-45]